MKSAFPTRLGMLILGDLVALGLVTVFGFGFHNESGAWVRMPTTFLPLVAAWCLAGIPIGVFDISRVVDMRQLWRVIWAMALAASLAGVMRGAWLGTPVQPVFVLVIGGISALALVAWRLIYWLAISRRGELDG